MTHEQNPPDEGSPLQRRVGRLDCLCSIIHTNYGVQPHDADGCLLPMGHDGPHEFADPSGQHWLWETDLECDCEWCMSLEGDYCTIYWRKPANVF